jgi:hypothetical protein
MWCFAGQNIDVNVAVAYDIAGNGNILNNGARPFAQNPIGNTITVSSTVNGNVYGSFSSVQNVEVSGNTVNITPMGNVVGESRTAYIYGGRIDNNGSGSDNIVNVNLNVTNGNIGGIYGSKVFGQAGDMSRNIVNINIGTGNLNGGVFGVWVSEATPQSMITNNKAIVKASNGNVGGGLWAVIGTYIDKGNCNVVKDNEIVVDVNGILEGYVCGVDVSSLVVVTAINNTVIINNGIIENPSSVYGANIDNNGDVIGNSITINNGTFKHIIIGGITGRALYSIGTGNAINNTVTINGGVVTHGTGNGCSILGGSSGGGNSTGNKIIINGGTINANRIFAAESDAGNVINNTVTIQGDANVDADLICGGFVWNNPDADMFTGNTLNLGITGVMVNGLDHFENYNFYLQENSNATPMITVRQGGKVVNNNNEAIATGGAIDLGNTNINIYASSNSKVNAGDSYVLIRSTNGISGTPKNIDSFMQKGLAVYYDCDINITDTELIAQINQNGGVNPVFPRGYSAGIAVSNLGADLVVGAGMQEIVKLNSFDKHVVNSFGIFSGQKCNYGASNSRVNINGVSLLAGIVGEVFDSIKIGIGIGDDINVKSCVTGIFVEYGNSNFDFREESINMPIVKSQGEASYAGGGVFGRRGFKSNVYCEISLRAGQSKTDCNSEDLKDPISGIGVKYDYDALYFGLHLGSGYTHKFNNNLSADFYGK